MSHTPSIPLQALSALVACLHEACVAVAAQPEPLPKVVSRNGDGVGGGGASGGEEQTREVDEASVDASADVSARRRLREAAARLQDGGFQLHGECGEYATPASTPSLVSFLSDDGYAVRAVRNVLSREPQLGLLARRLSQLLGMDIRGQVNNLTLPSSAPYPVEPICHALPCLPIDHR